MDGYKDDLDNDCCIVKHKPVYSNLNATTRLLYFFAVLMSLSLAGCNSKEPLMKLSRDEILELKENQRWSLDNAAFETTDHSKATASELERFKRGEWAADYYADGSHNIRSVVIRPATYKDNILAILIKNIGYHPGDKVPLVSINCDSLEFIIDDLYRLETEEIKNLLDTTPPDTLGFFDFRRLIIASIEKDCGLPTLEEHGERSVKVFWAFIQHNEKEQMAYYYRYIEGLVQSGDLHPERLVLVTDRLLVFNDYKQVYGSQIVNGELHPIENPDSVDYRRLEIGLEPLSEYLERFDLE